MICIMCNAYMLMHKTNRGWRKCPTCGFSCILEKKQDPKLDLDRKSLEPSEATKKTLGIKDEK